MTRRRAARDTRQPCTRRGKETLEALLGCAGEVFAERGYEAASVSAICRRAGVAQGTFYMYFSSKEDVYVRLVAQLQRQIIAEVRCSSEQETDPEARLVSAVARSLSFLSENRNLFQLFREAEFIRPEIPKRFYAAVCQELSEILRSGIATGSFRDINPEVAAYAILGMVFFLALRYALWGNGGVPSNVCALATEVMMSGIGAGRHETMLCGRAGEPSSTAGPPLQQEKPRCEGGEATRRALLDAAERAFGEAGFHRTSVAMITYLAGVGQGTFYLYFPSKVALFNELVREIGHQFRHGQSEAVAHCRDRREIEVTGLNAFFRWIREHPGAYRILREAEFVDDHEGKRHYQRLAEGYARGLSAGMERGEIRRCDPEALSYAMQGIAHLCGQRWALWGEQNSSVGTVLHRLADFLLNGLSRR